MGYRIGIDAGSKTIKIVVLNNDGSIQYSVYKRHRYDIRTMLQQAIHDLNWRYGEITGSIAVTGSAGIAVAQALNLPFVQEVVATTTAVQEDFPQADAVIELGGEDAKVIYLTGGLEQRMNASCAGGTGGFIDNMAYMLGVRTQEMSSLSLSAVRTYPIASRCAVFAQTDIRPLMNAGASVSDMAASTLDAVVRQTIGGLACGRPIQGTVVYLGGPFSYIPQLAIRFNTALGLDRRAGIRPSDAHLYTAKGAAYYGGQLEPAKVVSLIDVEEQLKEADFQDESLPRLQALFESEEELQSFKERKDVSFEHGNAFTASGNVFVGIDAGSTTVKLVVLDENDNLIFSDYAENKGNVLDTARTMLGTMYASLPREYKGELLVTIAQSCVTGYGEELLIKGLGVDSGVVETSAHLAAARKIDPDVSFMLDIGGQDMKALWVRDGIVEDTVLNEACSSGCGSFLSGVAWGLHKTKQQFSEAALLAKEPIDLGTKCTVFMNSRLKHAQKTGASTEDLAAGCVYSVVKNALFRIIGISNLDSLGEHIVVQGGTFKSDAVLRAFELIVGREVTRPKEAHLMGAIGAALIAKQRYMVKGSKGKSALISRDALKSFTVSKKNFHCDGCGNSCYVSLLSFDGKGAYLNGNKCMKAYEALDDETLKQTLKAENEMKAPNVFALERKLLDSYSTRMQEGALGQVSLGFISALASYEFIPFWHSMLLHCGFSVVMPVVNEDTNALASQAASTIPSESVCMPAKLAHRQLFSLANQGASVALMPSNTRGRHCAVSSCYAHALKDAAGRQLELARNLVIPELIVAKPKMFCEDEQSKQNLYAALAGIANSNGCELAYERFEEALACGLEELSRVKALLCSANEKALDWLAQQPTRRAIILAGRPYHVDKQLSHSIDEVLNNLGFAVLAPSGVPKQKRRNLKQMFEAQHDVFAWSSAKHFKRMAKFAAENPRVDVVYLHSFGCLYDLVSLEEAKGILHAANRPFTALKVDEIVDVAHIKIRLRTLAESLEQLDYQAQAELTQLDCVQTEQPELEQQHFKYVQCEQRQSGIEQVEQSKTCHASTEQTIRVVGNLGEDVLDAARNDDVSAFFNLNQDDVETARIHVHDLCYTSMVLMGRAIRIMNACPDLDQITMPYICNECILDSVQVLMPKVLEKKVVINWENDPDKLAAMRAPAFSTFESETDFVDVALKPLESSENAEVKVGIVGTASLCFDAFLNDRLLDLVKEQGCEPVLATLQETLVDELSYKEALSRFAIEGIKDVIVLQSFGCLKAHVQTRGALYALKQEFPSINITTLEYDSETSALNRENRIRLALASAKS